MIENLGVNPEEYKAEVSATSNKSRRFGRMAAVLALVATTTGAVAASELEKPLPAYVGLGVAAAATLAESKNRRKSIDNMYNIENLFDNELKSETDPYSITVVGNKDGQLSANQYLDWRTIPMYSKSNQASTALEICGNTMISLSGILNQGTEIYTNTNIVWGAGVATAVAGAFLGETITRGAEKAINQRIDNVANGGLYEG